MQITRRAFLGTAALAAPALVTAASVVVAPEKSPFKVCPRASGGPTASRFPQTIVVDQHKRKAWFYEELINQKVVLVNFTSVKSEKRYPILDNLVKVQDMLEDRLGKDVFMYTITTDPLHDSPEDLKKLADSAGAKWQFLTGKTDAVKDVLTAFGVRGSINAITWVGNEKTGRWLSRASLQHPLYIAESVARLSTGKHHKPFLVDMRSVS